jgi:hypothetical protein
MARALRRYYRSLRDRMRPASARPGPRRGRLGHSVANLRRIELDSFVEIVLDHKQQSAIVRAKLLGIG